MYYPYLRGKQYELILLREQAFSISHSDICPIIEPVKRKSGTLERALSQLIEANAKFVVIANPQYGDYVHDTDSLFDFYDKTIPHGYQNVSIGCIVNTLTSIDEIKAFFKRVLHENISIIHYGFRDWARLQQMIDESDKVRSHIFIEKHASRLYRNHFTETDLECVLIRDGFISTKNEAYPPSEHFSDLHITYTTEGVQGFGDFLIVGDEYREAGGPAYAVAIHITYLEDEDDMYIKHYVSDQTGSPSNIAGKFHEAVSKLVADCGNDGSHIFRSEACEEYIDLYNQGHFPGLGYAKKLSMQHHLELMSNYLSRR
ncbi:sce7725 family protein [candidate division KSB1 bacterium]|nr:sce7725 family protein [candidate division KSB1 bacterium]